MAFSTQEYIALNSQAELVTSVVEAIRFNLDYAIQERGEASLVLAGGTTFTQIYQELAKIKGIDWAKVSFFFGDERCVPLEDERSNFALAQKNLFVPLADHFELSIYRIPAEEGGTLGAEKYQEELFAYGLEEAPIFDVVLLGVGLDGHTASIYPQAVKENENSKELVVAAEAFQPPFVERITLTLAALNRSAGTIIVASGEEKEAIVKAVVEDIDDQYPVSLIKPQYGPRVLYFAK